jgi:hypothetical protein
MMQVEPKNHYNVLGRMGPLQPRPEYRPRPSTTEAESQKAGGEADKRGSSRAERRSALASVPGEGRLSLQAAKALTAATAEAIADLDPNGRKAPHAALERGASLMIPRYV